MDVPAKAPAKAPARRSRKKAGSKRSTEGEERPEKRSGESADGRTQEREEPRPKDGEPAASVPAARDGAPAKAPEGDESAPPRKESARQAKRRRWQERRRNRRGKGRGPAGQGAQDGDSAPREGKPAGKPGGKQGAEPKPARGMLVLEQANHGHLRQFENSLIPSKQDVHVAPRLTQKYGLRDGSVIEGTCRRGQGRHKWELVDVDTVDGKSPKELRNLPAFKGLRSIDPDFHYAVGDVSGETSLKIVDLLCPVGRGQRGLIVAPPRSGKTVLLKQFAHAIEKGYPEVHLIVLLVDERPEEATDWQRSMTTGQVFVSTNDEMPKKHVELAESVWRLCKRKVELGEDVILLMDSITRLGRAYNNVKGDSGRTMSGGLDTRALERPKQFFGSARNTETAGSLTILGTTLIQTGSRMDQVIFEEFKGTGNMELVLSRKLADRRIFPAMDIEKTGTRKDEKLHSSRRLHRVNTLRRVLVRMHWAEAMELLITKLDDVEKLDDFLERFEIDPEE